MPEVNEYGQPVGDVVPGWSTRAWPTPVRLAGRYVVLEPLSLAHAPALYDALGAPADRDLWTYRPTEQPDDVAAMAGLVDQLISAPSMEVWAVVLPDGAAGLTSFMRIDPATGQAEVAGVLYGRALQGTAASTEATHLLLRWAFDDLGYRRVEWKCDSLNEPSRRAALRLGFTYEGRFRHHMITKGRSRDTDWFSVTDTEWPAVRAAHEAWLDPATFDEAGRQRRPLTPPGVTVAEEAPAPEAPAQMTPGQE